MVLSYSIIVVYNKLDVLIYKCKSQTCKIKSQQDFKDFSLVCVNTTRINLLVPQLWSRIRLEDLWNTRYIACSTTNRKYLKTILCSTVNKNESLKGGFTPPFQHPCEMTWHFQRWSNIDDLCLRVVRFLAVNKLSITPASFWYLPIQKWGKSLFRIGAFTHAPTHQWLWIIWISSVNINSIKILLSFHY